MCLVGQSSLTGNHACLLYFLADYVLGMDSFEVWTPVRLPALANNISGYSDASGIVQGFTSGFALGVVDAPKLDLRRPRIKPTTVNLRDKISDEVSKGRLLGPFQEQPLPGMKVSPAYTIPKPGSDKTRLIFDLSYPTGGSVNSNIRDSYKSVSYCSVADVATFIYNTFQPGEGFLAKVDLADAYRIVPIRRADWGFLGMQVGEDIYIDRMLPMGAGCSCQIFQRISDALKWMLYKRYPTGVTVFNNLDDFLFVAASAEHCQAALRAFEHMCLEIGVPVAAHKTVGACTSLVFLGIGLCTVTMSMAIPDEKVKRYRALLRAFLSLRNPKVRLWQRIAGVLVHVSQVVWVGRAYLGSVHGSLRGILSQHASRRRRIGLEAKADLNVWLAFLEGITPNRIFRFVGGEHSTQPIIATDASSWWGSEVCMVPSGSVASGQHLPGRH